MKRKIEKIKKFRQFLLTQLAGLTAEELNKIPEGYNNNIIWNVAHLICAQQSKVFVISGLNNLLLLTKSTFYHIGLVPDPAAFIDDPEIVTIKSLFVSTIEDLQAYFDREIIGNYSPSENILRVYEIQLHNIDDALDFLLYHEGFHGGISFSMIHLVS